MTRAQRKRAKDIVQKTHPVQKDHPMRVVSPTLAERIREWAIERVDRRHGYTLELAPSRDAHRAEWAEEERKIAAEVAAEPGLIVCSPNHAHRHHYLGGGMRVCFECWARVLTGCKS